LAENEKQFTCSWIFDTLVVLCDGNVVCGCADPYGERPLGHLKENTLYEIWNSEKVQVIREDLNNGFSPFCLDCGLKQFVGDTREIPQRPVEVETLSSLFLENCVGCNISCFKSVCNQESGIIGTRSKKMMSLDEFKSAMDQVGEKLSRLQFFNYGEPFVHPRAVEMLEHAKLEYPHVYIYVSTNGLLITEDKMRRLIDAGVDEITFSVDGPDQETYVKYRQKGDFDKVFDIMRIFVKKRNRLGKEYPLINWRYILFKWNDSETQMNKARRLARKIGVDKLVWEITDHPEEAKSEKYQIGTPAWEKIYHEIWDTSHFASAIKSRRYRAKIKVLTKRIDVEAGKPLKIKVRAKNVGSSQWQRAALGWLRTVRLGGQLCDRNKNVIDRDFAREFIPRDTPSGRSFEMGIEIPPIEQPGEYLIEFDMVSEGMDWFKNLGSKVAWKKIKVVQRD